MFIIEDDFHGDLLHREFDSYSDAYKDLQRIALIPWGEEPNRCPCTNWRSCKRDYQIIEYDTKSTPWKELQRVYVLTITAKEIKWHAISDNML